MVYHDLIANMEKIATGKLYGGKILSKWNIVPDLQ
jgi:hypothetical protein